MNDYIFGYGSLICADSRARTGITGDAIPVTALNIERSWSVPVPEARTTAVGATQKTGARCNGVIFPVSEDMLEQFDIREAGYDRIRLSTDQIDSDQLLPDNLRIWVYVGQSTHRASPEHPIPQSYVDVIFNGCFSYGHQFTDTFIRSTSGWQHLINDRHAPRYPRAMADFRHADKVDSLLKQHLPDLF